MRILLAVAVASVVLPHEADAGQEDPAVEIMWRKLDLTHDALDALVLDDYEALEAYAEDLEMLADAGVQNILDTDEYRARAASFRSAARALGRAARERNTHAGTLAYWDLTLTCIRCHRSLGVLPR